VRTTHYSAKVRNEKKSLEKKGEGKKGQGKEREKKTHMRKRGWKERQWRGEVPSCRKHSETRKKGIKSKDHVLIRKKSGGCLRQNWQDWKKARKERLKNMPYQGFRGEGGGKKGPQQEEGRGKN